MKNIVLFIILITSFPVKTNAQMPEEIHPTHLTTMQNFVCESFDKGAHPLVIRPLIQDAVLIVTEETSQLNGILSDRRTFLHDVVWDLRKTLAYAASINIINEAIDTQCQKYNHYKIDT